MSVGGEIVAAGTLLLEVLGWGFAALFLMTAGALLLALLGMRRR